MDFTVVDEEAAVPIIDVGPLLDPHDPSAARAAELAVVGQIGKACEEWGFFQVINHGIPLDLIEEVLASSRIFFEYPAQEKMKARVRAAGRSACNAFMEELPQLG